MTFVVTQTVSVSLATFFTGNGNYDNLHSQLGIAMSVIVIVILLLGLTSARVYSDWRNKVLRIVHGTLAKLLFFTGLVNVYYGNVMAYTGNSLLLSISLTVSFAFISLFIITWIIITDVVGMKKFLSMIEDMRYILMPQKVKFKSLSRTSMVITSIEFQKKVANGEKWVKIDQDIYDLKDFMDKM
jgi:predicted membrane protein